MPVPRSKVERLALLLRSVDVGRACGLKPLDGREVLRLEAAAAGPLASDLADADGDCGQRGDADGDPQQLASALERGAVEVDWSPGHCVIGKTDD